MKKILIILSAILAAVLLCCGIVGCTSQPDGTFYSLDEAYTNGWLSQDDLKNIAYYYHTQHGETEHIDESFTPTPKTPETLSEEVQKKIKRTYLNDVLDMPDGSLDRVIIHNYFGTYNGNIVLHISDDYNGYDYVFDPVHEIGGVSFYEYVSAFLRVWREKGN